MAISLGIGAVVVDQRLTGWGSSIGVVLCVIGAAVFILRRYWRMTAFWITLVLLAVLQVPFVLFLRPLLSDYQPHHWVYMFGSALIDFFLVAYILNLVCLGREERSHNQ